MHQGLLSSTPGADYHRSRFYGPWHVTLGMGVHTRNMSKSWSVSTISFYGWPIKAEGGRDFPQFAQLMDVQLNLTTSGPGPGMSVSVRVR